MSGLSRLRLRQRFLLLLAVVVSVAFLVMVRAFLLTIVLAAVLAGLLYPAYQRLGEWMGGRRRLAALVTIVAFLLVVAVPLLATGVAVVAESSTVTQAAGQRLRALADQPGEIESRIRAIPGWRWVAPYEDEIFARAGEAVGNLGTVLFDTVTTTTRRAVVFVALFVIMLYTLYFFLVDGPRLRTALLSHVPLDEDDKERLVGTFLSMTRAILKGSLLVALVQGVLGGLAFWLIGIESALFWGALMTVLAVLPGLGTVLVWLPAAIYLLATGAVWQGTVLLAVGTFVISTIDNFLRPRLVGRDTHVHELLIFFSTLGGLALFGVMGFIVGPILGALFVTIWQALRAAYHNEFA